MYRLSDGCGSGTLYASLIINKNKMFYMKKNIISAIVLIMISMSAYGQKYFSKTGDITFFSATPIENIEAKSHTASTVIDIESGKVQWAVLIKSFEFEKALMQEHFNENYMESTKYPKAKFKGTIVDKSKINFAKDGTYNVVVEGTLEIHGVKKEVSTMAKFEITNGEIVASSDLKVLVADYDIDIPSVVRENIAKEIEISIKGNYEALNKT